MSLENLTLVRLEGFGLLGVFTGKGARISADECRTCVIATTAPEQRISLLGSGMKPGNTVATLTRRAAGDIQLWLSGVGQLGLPSLRPLFQ